MSQQHYTDDVQDRGSYYRLRASKEAAAEEARSLKEWADRGHAALGERDWPLVQSILEEQLLPALDWRQREAIAERGRAMQLGLVFEPKTLTRYQTLREEGRFPTLDPGGSTRETGFQQHVLGEQQQDLLEAAFRTAYAALVVRDRVDHEVTTEVPASEYVHQVGERYYAPDSVGDQPVQMIDPDDDWKATLLTGGQGSGKSSTGFTLGEDRFAAGHKIVDLVDMSKAENVMWDVESRHDALRRAREEMGLGTEFLDPVRAGCAWLFDDETLDGYLPPEMEIRLPLTHELADSTVPFDSAADEPVVKPFTIPASDLSYRQLVMLLPHTTKTQENYLHSAHQILKNRDTDWTLSDMADTVRDETNAGEAVAARIRRALETTQQKAFIRDSEADHQLDWDDIMADRGTVTAFSVYMIDEKTDKLALASYLIDSLYEARKTQLRRHDLDDYPPLTVILRELHDIAPRQKAEQDSEATFEGYMIDLMGEVLALMRHVNMEIIADTQKFKQQLAPEVSGLFHRVFAFNGHQPDIKTVFRTRVDETDIAEKVSTYETGKCALVHSDGYTTPIQMAPPRMHHLDAKQDGDGLGARVKYLDGEELREAPWDATVPPRLRFDEFGDDPLGEFIFDHVEITKDRDDRIVKQDFSDAYNAWARANDTQTKSHQAICRWIHAHLEIEDGQPDRKTVWYGLRVYYDEGWQRSDATTHKSAPKSTIA